MTGEMDFLRKEIAFVGDVLNVTARMLDACRDLNRSLLVSRQALEKMRPGPEIEVQPLQEIALRGKQIPVVLAAVELKGR